MRYNIFRLKHPIGNLYPGKIPELIRTNNTTDYTAHKRRYARVFHKHA